MFPCNFFLTNKDVVLHGHLYIVIKKYTKENVL